MAIQALQLKLQADTAVATRAEAIAFANAALAKRTYCGDPLKDFSAAEQALAKAKFAAVAEYHRLRARAGMTRRQAANSIRARRDLATPLAEAKLAVNPRNLDHWLAIAGGTFGRRPVPPDVANTYALCRNYARGAAQRIERHELDPAFLREFMRAYLNQNRLLVSPAYRAAAEICRGAGQRDIPREHQVRYWLDSRIDASSLAMARRGAEDYDATLGGYILREWDCEVGAVLVGDHRVLDIWVKVWDAKAGRWIAQRPWITAWMDVKSGFVVAALIYVDAYPNHRKILEALYLAIKVNGNRPFLKIVTDNGKDYLKQGACKDARLQPSTEPTRGRNRFNTLLEETFGEVTEYRHSVLRSLGIEHVTARPYKGRQKPIERRFRDFAQQFDKLWPGYTGNSPATRPEYGQQYRGNPELLPTCEDVVTAFRTFLGQYHSRPNKSRITGGRPPAELWAERQELAPALTDDQLDWAMLLPHRHSLQVRRGPTGSDVWYYDWPYGGATPDDCLALHKYHGQETMVKTSWAPDPEATFEWRGHTLPDRLWVFTLDGKFICEGRAAVEIPVFGKSAEQKQELAVAMHKIAAIRKADRLARDTARERKIVAFPAQKLYRAAAAGDDTAALDGIQPSSLPGPGKGRAKTTAPEMEQFHALVAGRMRTCRPPTDIDPGFRDIMKRRSRDEQHEEDW
jgi:putative transposase